MKPYSFVCVLTLLLASRSGPPSLSQETLAKISLGIFPVYDASGEGHGEAVARNLTDMIFEQLRETPLEPVFLNPGGAYSPSGEEWLLEYAQAAEVDAVLIATLLPSDRPKKGSGALRVESYLLDVRTRQRSQTLAASTPVRKRDLERGLEFGFAGPEYYAPSRKFEKQPLGKAAKKLAEAVAASTKLHVPRLAASGTARPLSPAEGSCAIRVRVVYTQNRSASKNYYLTINGREETLGIVDGVAKVELASGPVVMHAAVKDAPYKLAVQRSYAANTYLDCGRPERTLVLEIGPVGEAFLRWRP